MDEVEIKKEYQDDWHLDRRVPIGLIITVMLQTLFAGWFFSEIRGDLDNTISAVERLDLASSAENLRQWDRINLVEDNVQSALSAVNTNKIILERIEDDLDSVVDLLRKSLSVGTVKTP